MPNPLEVGSPPDTPNADPQQAMQGNGAQPGQPAPPQRPAPSHAQAVVALKHFSVIGQGIQKLLGDPNLGKASIKSQIIDEVTTLVSERYVSPASAVMMLSQVPDDPLDQRKWLIQNLNQTRMSAMAVLHDHRMTADPEAQHDPYNQDNHMTTMSGVTQHYRPQPNAR